MKVRELIEILQKVPPEWRVVVDGYEGGYCDIHTAEAKVMVIDYDQHRVEQGPHESLDQVQEYDGDKYNHDQVETTFYIG